MTFARGDEATMKIVCDSCSTKYSIADEKVRGKVFKIKCKKCSHVIVVKGDPETAEPKSPSGGFDQKETRVFDYGEQGAAAAAGGQASASDEPRWHLVVDREQVGPMTAAEVQDRWTRGEINAETYAWREGFADWQRIGAIEELDFLTSGGGATKVSPNPSFPSAAEPGGLFSAGAVQGSSSGPFAKSDPSDLFSSRSGGIADDEGAQDLFASAPPTVSSSSAGEGAVFSSAQPPAEPTNPQPARKTQPHGGDLFAPAGAEAAPRGSAASSPAVAQAEVSVDPRLDVRPLAGQRNENSVLFSLKNLTAMANESAPKPSSPSTPGFASGGGSEASGLIDIRAMASMTMGGKKEEGVPRNDDGLPIFAPSAFAAPPSGVLIPTASSSQPKWMNSFVIGGIAVLAVAVVVLGVLVFKGRSTSVAGRLPEGVPVSSENGLDVPPSGEKGSVAEENRVALPGTTTAPPSPAPPPSSVGTSPAPAPSAAPTPSSRESRTSSKEPQRRAETRNEARTETKEKRGREREPEKQPARSSAASDPAPKASKEKCDEVACLVDSTLPCCRKGGSSGSSSSSSSSASAGGSNLPSTLSRSDIVSGIGTVRGRVMSCNDQYKVAGTVMVKLLIDNDGTVSSASVQGSFAGTPTGSCVERATKAARFKKFSGAKVPVQYPFVFR
ncbi:MAG: zinc-ribbon domain-containing protein [Deltaproteobacteria bacterium]|nr:zinc-ribbon domain-containing protein [Deltaproteobacteria bacterium]